MKESTFIFIFLLQMLQLAGQEVYYVTMVKGKVFKQSHTQIGIGDKIKSNEKVTFTSKKDFIILLNVNGRYIVSPSRSIQAKKSELVNLLVNDNIHLHAQNKKLSSRAITGAISLTDYFKPEVLDGTVVNEKLLIVDTTKISLRSMGYTGIDNSKKFFFLQLIDTNKHVVSKILPVINDTLLLKKQDFIFNHKLYSTEDGSLTIGIVDDYPRNNKINKIADLNPNFVSKQELRKFVYAIKLSLPHVPQQELFNEIYTELNFFYGKPDEYLVTNLIIDK